MVRILFKQNPSKRDGLDQSKHVWSSVQTHCSYLDRQIESVEARLIARLNEDQKLEFIYDLFEGEAHLNQDCVI